LVATKLFNAGQTCMAPDYVIVPRRRIDEFVAAVQASTRRMYPDALNNPDYTSIISERHLARLQGLLDDARSRGATVVTLSALEAGRLPRMLPPALVGRCVAEAGIAFMFAPLFHPALKHVVPVRKAMRMRTVFNLLGPLVNPLRPEAQVLGVGGAHLLDPMAEALARLGLERAVVVHGDGGLDEASLSGPSQLRLVEGGTVRAEQLDPSTLGLAAAPLSALAGGDVAANAAILEAVLQGRGRLLTAADIYL
jgi:anthranilate phosphoribosyltransferase